MNSMKTLNILCIFSRKRLKIGDKYQGGIIAYFLKKGDEGFVDTVLHGLIAAPSDQSSGISWNKREFKELKNTQVRIGSGLSNTIAITKSLGSGSYAASICLDLTIDGYHDWFLPSLEELNKLYLSRNKIGGFSPKHYWSSSHCGHNTAQNLLFTDGTNGNNYRIQELCVRAVRAF